MEWKRRTLNCRRIQNKNKLKAEWKESEMEQKQVPLTRPKNGIQGPLDIFTACYPPLTGQTQHCWPWTGQQAYCSQGTVLPSCTIPVSMLKKCEEKREGVRSLFKIHPTK